MENSYKLTFYQCVYGEKEETGAPPTGVHGEKVNGKPPTVYGESPTGQYPFLN